MKVCIRCGKERPISDFKLNPKMKSGRVNQCRDCLNDDAKKARHNHIEKVRANDRNRSKNDERYKSQKKAAYIKKKDTISYKEKIKEYRKTDNIVNSEKYKTRKITKEAIRKGEIERLSCFVCGDPKSEAHHKDYSDPFDIIFLCRKHHARLHTFLRSEIRRKA